jgi:transcription antitermination factor NusA-like protein
MAKIINYVLTFVGGGTIMAVVVVIWVLNNLEKAQKIVGWFYRTFSWVYKKCEYGNVAINVQATVNTVGAVLDREAPGILPHPMRIEWAKTARAAEAFLRDGQIVVAMDYSPNRDRNLVVSTLAYLGKGLLPRARPYIDKTLMRATDFTVAKGIFMSTRKGLPVQFFFENYVQPEIEKDPRLRDDCTLLDRVESAGFLSRIFLPQLQYVGDKLFPATPDETTQLESRDFARFVEEIATRESGVKSDLTFARSRIRTSVLLVAREETRVFGTAAYARRVKMCLDRGIEHIYICARKAQNISLAEEVATQQEKAGRLTVLARHRFKQTIKGEERSAICIVCAVNLLTAAPGAMDSCGVVYRLLEEHIEEVSYGQIEVMALARQPGVKSKIAVRSVVDGLDALPCCTERARLCAMESALGGEKLEFVHWSDDPGALIVASLTPLDPSHVLQVTTNVETHQAVVQVDGWKAKRAALGHGDQNLSCAIELTGWRITVEEPPKDEDGSISSKQNRR